MAIDAQSTYDESTSDRDDKMMNRKVFFTIGALLFGISGGVGATVSPFFSAGNGCSTAISSATFFPGNPGSTVEVSLCVSTTTESVCGATIQLQAANSGESARFKVTNRTLGGVLTDPTTSISYPVSITNPAQPLDFGAIVSSATPPPAGAGQLLATFQLQPQSTATNGSYVISLTNLSSISTEGANCFGSPVDFSINPTLTLVKSGSTDTGVLVTRYRLYSPATSEHLYTTDFTEYSVLPACCSWIPEGPIYRVFQGPGSYGGVAAVPYYRLYNPSSGQHHWTTDLNEYNFLQSVGWSQEGIDGYILPSQVAGTLALYRLYLNASGGLHLWTIDQNEVDYLTANAGWTYEGIAGYVIPLP